MASALTEGTMRHLLPILILTLAALNAPHARAQQVPDEMPFDVSYGPAITAERAVAVVEVVAEATRGERVWKLSIAVVDPAGELVYYWRMDETQYASGTIAINKARTAARFRRSTQAFFDAMQSTGGSILATLEPTLVASPGGIPIVEGGRIIGAVGCSGATGAQDHVACLAGAESVR